MDNHLRNCDLNESCYCKCHSSSYKCGNNCCETCPQCHEKVANSKMNLHKKRCAQERSQKEYVEQHKENHRIFVEGTGNV